MPQKTAFMHKSVLKNRNTPHFAAEKSVLPVQVIAQKRRFG
jgi:hypothetical protein